MFVNINWQDENVTIHEDLPCAEEVEYNFISLGHAKITNEHGMLNSKITKINKKANSTVEDCEVE